MSQMTLQQAFAAAIAHHQAGRLREAEHLYRQILAHQPRHPEALRLLGVLAYQVGNNQAARELLRQSIAANPLGAEAHANLGLVLDATGDRPGAIAAFRRAIDLKPDHFEAHGNLGNTLLATGDTRAAIDAYQRAVTIQPAYADGWCNLGSALRSQRRLTESVAAYSRAISLNPKFAEGHSNLGNALKDLDQVDEAIAAYRQAITLRPQYAEAHYNLGNALKDARRPGEAVDSYRQAIALNPNLAEAHNNLGLALKDFGLLDDAVASYHRAIALRPAYPEALNNLGLALQDRGELDNAFAAYRQAMALKPDDVAAHSNLIFGMNYHPRCDASAVADELSRWNCQHAEPLRGAIKAHTNNRNPQKRLRIGYISADFCAHASAYFLMPLFENHDPAQVEFLCYAQVARPDAVTARMQQLAAGWRATVGRSDDEVADQIRQDQIDILVDLKLHTSHHRLLVLARKPAPVQVTWLGYPGSTGMTTVDYRLTDPYLDPPGIDESVYSEKTIRLPDTFWCYDPREGRQVPTNPLPARSAGHITFGSLNNFCKVGDQVLQTWARILAAVPHSRLLLLAPEGIARQRTLDAFSRYGITLDRIEFVGRQPRRAYLETYHRIDIGLDTFTCNGHTTSLDSFWMGVPVVTLSGPTAVGRAGVSQLMNLQLPEFVATTLEAYERIAIARANDLAKLEDLRRTLRPRIESSPLMDARRFARNIESAYREMWKHWCR